MILSEALCIGAFLFGTLAFTAAISPPSLFFVNSIAANQTTPSNFTTAYTLPPDPYVYTSAHPLIITFHTFGAPLWAYSVEHIIVDAILAALEHDDNVAIDAKTLRYEDVDFPNKSAALEMFFRKQMTWHGWTLVVDALQKVFKGDYVHCLFDVMKTVPQAEVEYLGIGRLYDPNNAQAGTAGRSFNIGLA